MGAVGEDLRGADRGGHALDVGRVPTGRRDGVQQRTASVQQHGHLRRRGAWDNAWDNAWDSIWSNLWDSVWSNA
ncbi:hypothetical protein Ssi03_69720 [Sphaerisporangium siamense]|nr:hypothetical protein Ssi03_69720 [Sphaerisporangium siamense]